MGSIIVVSGFLLQYGAAQLSTQVVSPDGQTVDVTGKNVARGDDSLILYDAAYGPNTRTNPYGVEVIAIPVDKNTATGQTYRVRDIRSVWECSQNKALQCGSAEIPSNGIVLSAMGNRRDALKNLKIGDSLVLRTGWFQQRQSPISVINPTPQNNPAGSGFPGYRASNQLVVYDAGSGRPNTGTNEFGFEVTVRNGIVTAQEGSDSTIPADGFVLSGHGKARGWLIANAPLGAKITINPDQHSLTSLIDFDTYAYQFDQQWAQSPCSAAAWSTHPNADPLCGSIRNQKDEAIRLQQQGQPEQAATALSEALESLNRRIWMSYEPFPANTLRGVWHRPVETTATTIGNTLDRLQAAGINTIFLETFFHGYTIFPSKTFQAYGLPAENPKFGGQDLLKLWVSEAHRRGMKVHTWFQTFYGGTNAYLPPGPILTKYPRWANVQYAALVTSKAPTNAAQALPNTAQKANGSGVKAALSTNKAPLPSTSGSNSTTGTTLSANSTVPTVASLQPLEIKKAPAKPTPSNLELGAYFLDPMNPDVQTFLIKLAEEMVTQYDIDGFQMDYIRYPASFPADRFSYRKTTWGYTDIARSAFKAKYGIDPVDIDPKDPNMATLWIAWSDFKTQQISQFVHKLSQDLREKRPGIQLSAAVFPDADSALALKHQDWRTWGQNGWVDFFAPMTLTSATKVVDRDTRVMIQATHYKIPVFSGIFGPFNDNSAEQILRQIDTAKTAGASGYVLFDTAHLSPRMLDALKTAQMPRQNTSPSMTPLGGQGAAPNPNNTPHQMQPAPSSPSAPNEAPPKKKHWWNF